MHFMAIIGNELPFMVHLPNGEYIIKSTVGGVSKQVKIKLSNDMFRLRFSPFPEEKLGWYVEGTAEDLQKYAITEKLSNYSFEKLKSYVTCTEEATTTCSQVVYDAITQEQLIDRLETLLLKQGVNVNGSGNLNALAQQEYLAISRDASRLQELKNNYLTYKGVNEVSNVLLTHYLDALNIFIRQYAYIRNDFFVEPLTIHTLGGSYYTQYVDGRIYERIKHASKMPTILPTTVWRDDIEPADLQALHIRLQNNEPIPPKLSLINVARNLCERGEYRSAVIESSAALEIAVEQKLMDKMRAQGLTEPAIATELDMTKMNFRRRCDSQLSSYTGTSFVNNNSALWNTIDQHRKNYRHKIAHSTVLPDERITNQIIDDFEAAIRFIDSL